MSSKDVLWVLASAFCHALWNTQVKRSRSPAGFLFLLTSLSTLVALPLFVLLPVHAIPAELAWLALASALTHGASFVTLALAYEAGELSVVYPISRSTPLVVPLLAVPFLGERVSLAGALGIALAVLGLWLVQTQGSIQLAAWKSRAALYAFIMLLLTALFSLVDKRAMAIVQHLPWPSPVPASAFFYAFFTAGSALVCLPFALQRSGRAKLVEQLRGEAGTISWCAAITWASYAVILEVLRRAPVSYVVAVRQISVLFAVALAMWSLGERPGRARIAGAFASVLGVALIAHG